MSGEWAVTPTGEENQGLTLFISGNFHWDARESIDSALRAVTISFLNKKIT